MRQGARASSKAGVSGSPAIGDPYHIAVTVPAAAPRIQGSKDVVVNSKPATRGAFIGSGFVQFAATVGFCPAGQLIR